MSDIPDEAVEAAMDAYHKATGGMPIARHDMKPALEAAEKIMAAFDKEMIDTYREELTLANARIKKLEEGIRDVVRGCERETGLCSGCRDDLIALLPKEADDE